MDQPDVSDRPDRPDPAVASSEDERPLIDDDDDDLEAPLSVPFEVPEADLVDQRRPAGTDDEAWNHE